MPLDVFPRYWSISYENGFRIERTQSPSLSGDTSLRLITLVNEYDHGGGEGFQKSGSIFLRDDFYPGGTGLVNGRLRTLIRRLSTNPDRGWAGFFFMADSYGIGDRFVGPSSMYTVHDQGGEWGLYKVNPVTAVLLESSGVSLPHNTTVSLEVSWRYHASTQNVIISVSSGSATDYSDFSEIIHYVDSVNAYSLSVSEGLFGATLLHNDECSYIVDKYTIDKVFSL